MPLDHQRFIERQPHICGGEADLQSTRVTVRTLFASLVEGASVDEIGADLLTVQREAGPGMLAYAASAEGDMPVPTVPSM